MTLCAVRRQLGLGVRVCVSGLPQANQAFCGRVILEMWSSDLDGFPMPAGCFYTEATPAPKPSLSPEVKPPG